MDTAITMVQPETHSAERLLAKFFRYGAACGVLLVCSPVVADVTLTPEIETAAYGFWLRDASAGGGLDKGLAFMAAPALTFSHKGQSTFANFNVKNESIWYDDSQRDHKSLTNYYASTGLALFDGRVALQLDAKSDYQVRSSQTNIFSDIITGSENLAKNSSYGASINFRNRNQSVVSIQASLAYKKLDSELPESDDGLGSFDNDTVQAALQFGAGNRAKGAFWLLSGSHNKLNRQEQGDFTSQQANLVAGLPLFSGLSAIVRASYQDNNNGRENTGEGNFFGFFRTFKSYGAGLEYRFGKTSYLNITRNRSERGGEIQLPDTDTERDEDDFYAAELYFAPSRRSSLQYTLDRQFLGRTTSIAGQYNMRSVTARLSVSETLQVLTNLDQIFEDLGIFVCPIGSQQLGDCVKPPTNNYQLQPGESLQQFFQPGFDVSEELVRRRSALFNLGYSKRRLKLNLSLSKLEDEYEESARVTQTELVNVLTSWQLGQHSRFHFSASHYDMSYSDNTRTDKNILVETGFERDLNANASVKLMFRRTERNSSEEEFDLSENRVWLSYRHKL